MHKQSELGHIYIGDAGEMAACLTLLYSFDKTQVSGRDPESIKRTTFMNLCLGKKGLRTSRMNIKARMDLI